MAAAHLSHALASTAHGTPPTLGVCAAEHVDKLLLAALSLVGVCGLLALGMGRLVKGEVHRAAARHGVTPSRKRGTAADARPHAV